MNKNLLSLICGLAMLTASCKKDGTVIAPVTDSSIADLVVPKSFNWQTSRDVSFSIGISDTRFENRFYVIGLYLADPGTGAAAVSTGAASLVTPYNAKITVPADVNGVFVVKTAVDGSSITQYVALTSQTMVSISLGATAINNFTLPTAKSSIREDTKLSKVTNATSAINITMPLTLTEPGCGVTVTGTSVTSSSTRVTCYTSTIDTRLNIAGTNGGVLKINAPGKTVTIGTITHSRLTIFVGANTTVIFPDDFALLDGETIVNNGVINGVDFTTSGDFFNNATAKFTGSFTVSTSGTVTNKKSFVATGLNTINGGIFSNECNTDINGIVKISSNSGISNTGFITADNTYILSDGYVYLNDGAMYQTNVLSQSNGYVYGDGSPSLFKVVTSVTNEVVSNSGIFYGSVQYCGAKDINTFRLHFFNGAIQACGLYIPIDACNSVGNAIPVPIKPDTDADGIIDVLDAYPNDKTKAFNNFSANYGNGGSTVAFEDSWPSQGDYDLNDVVLTYKHLVITNASNIVVRVEGEWNLIATGGEYQNGAGIQFPISKSNITNFTSSNGLPAEAGQDSLVVTLFTNSRALQSTWNTINGQAVSPTMIFTFGFDVVGGPSISTMGVSSYNPFIWNNSANFGRGYETHLYGDNPTKLANTSLFGTKSDNSKLGKYYSTTTNLPWGIEIPVADFKYPVEYKPVSVAYLKFNIWASSGGITSKDWYSGILPEFRNINNLYSGK
jgi:LruC domain-containing protein